METEYIIEIVQDNIKIVKFNKPKKKNALDFGMYKKIANILNETANDDSIIATVLTGTGDFYSSGNDLSAVTTDHIASLRAVGECIEAFVKFPKLLFAIVNGPAIGIAATTLALCDLVFAAENAYFLTPFTKLGLTAEGCSTVTFPKLIGERKAIEMLLFNYKLSAQEALDCGFINYIFKPDEIQTKVWEKIVQLTNLPTDAVLSCKKLAKYNIQELLDANAREIQVLEKAWTSRANNIEKSKL